MANYPHLLGNDVQLLAGLNADLLQGRAIMRTDTIRLWQLMANNGTWQSRIEWFSATLGALVGRNINAFALAVLFLRCRLRLRTQNLGLIEEHVLLVLAADLALGGKDFAHEFVQALLEQVTFAAYQNQFVFGGCQGLLQGCNFFGGGHQIH